MEEKNKQSRVWVSSKRKKGEVCDTFLAFGAFVGERERVFERNSHKVTRNADLSSHDGQPGLWVHTSKQSASPDFYWLPCSVNFSVLPPSLDWLLLLILGPSFRRPLQVSWEISRASPLCGFRTKTDKGIFWLALTHIHENECHPSCHKGVAWLVLYKSSELLNTYTSDNCYRYKR